MRQIETLHRRLLLITVACALVSGCAPDTLEKSEALRARHEKTQPPKESPASREAQKKLKQAEAEDSVERPGRGGELTEQEMTIFRRPLKPEDGVLVPHAQPTVSEHFQVEFNDDDMDHDSEESPGTEPSQDSVESNDEESISEDPTSDESNPAQTEEAQAVESAPTGTIIIPAGQKTPDQIAQDRLSQLLSAISHNDFSEFNEVWSQLTPEKRTELVNASDPESKSRTFLHVAADVKYEFHQSGVDDADIMATLCPLATPETLSSFDSKGLTALQYAVSAKNQNFKMAEELLKCGADVNLRLNEQALSAFMLITSQLRAGLFFTALQQHGGDLRQRWDIGNPLYPEGINLLDILNAARTNEENKIKREIDLSKASGEEIRAHNQVMTTMLQNYQLIADKLSQHGLQVTQPVTSEEEQQPAVTDETSEAEASAEESAQIEAGEDDSAQVAAPDFEDSKE